MLISQGFPSSLLQLAFPAALQLISILFPLLYVLKQDSRLGDLFEKSKVFVPLVGALAFSLVLYIASIVLLLTSNFTISGEGAWSALPGGAGTLAAGSVVLGSLLVFTIFPVYFAWDVWRSRASRGEELAAPQSGELEGLIRSFYFNNEPKLTGSGGDLLHDLCVGKLASLEMCFSGPSEFTAFASQCQADAVKLAYLAARSITDTNRPRIFEEIVEVLRSGNGGYTKKKAKEVCKIEQSRAFIFERKQFKIYREAIAAAAILELMKRVNEYGERPQAHVDVTPERTNQ